MTVTCHIEYNALYPSVMIQSNCIVDTFILAFDDHEKLKTMIAQPLMYMKKYHDVDIVDIEKMLTED